MCGLVIVESGLNLREGEDVWIGDCRVWTESA
jgi:hypothetical protein